MVFAPGGQLTFHGGLEFYNPGRWELDPAQQELRLSFPETDVDRLRIFQLSVGDGVKAFDRVRKQVTYHFDEQTWTLNVGGWPYTKAGNPGSPALEIKRESEPVFK